MADDTHFETKHLQEISSNNPQLLLYIVPIAAKLYIFVKSNLI